MERALHEARAAAERGEVPVGAVIVAADGTVLAATGNRTEETHDPTAHAEMLAIRAAAAKLGTARLVDCDLYVTLEPCTVRASSTSRPAIIDRSAIPASAKARPAPCCAASSGSGVERGFCG